MTWQQTDPAKTPWDGNRATWMSQLADNLPIQDLSIPGTHDSASLEGFTHFAVSETQQWKIEDQLKNGIRFLDLRVKIMFSHKGLAMYHGVDALYDPDKPRSFDQLYYKAVIGKCVQFLRQHPKEVVVLSVKCEGDTSYDGWSVEDWFRQIANEVAADNPPGTWDKWWDYRSNVNATLGDVRGKMILWRRFPRGGQHSSLSYNDPFALDLTPLNGKYDNTKGADWYTPEGGYTYAQDHYTNTTVKEKAEAWYGTLGAALMSRWQAGGPHSNRQFINFTSIGAGKKPRVYATVMNKAVNEWHSAMLSGRDKAGVDLGGQKVRSGFGVVPMDFPTQDNVDLLVRANFGWTHRLAETQAGTDYWQRILDEIKRNEP